MYAIYGSSALQASSDGTLSWHVVYPPPLPDAPTCTDRDLQLSAKWSRTSDPGEHTTSNTYPYTGIVSAELTLTNRTPDTCRLTASMPHFRLIDSTVTVVAQDLGTPDPGYTPPAFVLGPNESAGTSVEWGQWCSSAPPNEPLTLAAEISGVGTFTGPAEDADGQAIAAPFCHTVFASDTYLRPGSLGPIDVPANAP